jgi:hypothetical protein
MREFDNTMTRQERYFTFFLFVILAIIVVGAFITRPAAAETAGRDIIRCMPKSVCLPEVHGTTTVFIEAANVIERADSIRAQCLLIAATIHTESGRGRLGRGALVDPFEDPQFKHTVNRCIAQFPKE